MYLLICYKQVIIDVSPEHFGSMRSDDTRNTHNTWGLAQGAFVWLLNAPDPCHSMSNLIKDITALVQFKPVRKNEPIAETQTHK
jgi:hypothetical protein